MSDPVSVLEYALQVQKRAQRVQDLEIEINNYEKHSQNTTMSLLKLKTRVRT